MKTFARCVIPAALTALLLVCALLLFSCAAPDAKPATGAQTPSAETQTDAPTVLTATTVTTVPTATTAPEKSGTGTATPDPTVSDPPAETTGTAEPSITDPRPLLSCRADGDGGTVACWWWNRSDAVRASQRDKYLDFLADNGVSLVYLCLPDFTARQLSSFVRAAAERSISVSLLTGDVSFLDPENATVAKVIDEYLAYQKNAAPNEKLCGLHFDVEPHQRPDFSENRDAILDLYADFVVRTCAILHEAGERVEWDIPFWFDSFTVGAPDGGRVSLLELLADNADALCLMSYRNTAAAVLDLSEEEIEVCRRHGIGVICGLDAYSEEGPDVSFAGKSKEDLYRVAAEVYRTLRETSDGGEYGIAIHYLDTWYALMDRASA